VSASAIWWLWRNVQERIILCSVTSRLAERNLREITKRCATDSIQKVCGKELGHPAKGPKKWLKSTGEQILLNRPITEKTGESVLAMGVDSSEVGAHCSRMIIDDMVDEAKVATTEAREAVWEWFGRLEAVIDADAHEYVWGTRWHYDDPYQRMIDMGTWATFIREDIDETGEPIFPEMFSLERLAYIRRKQGDYWYSLFYKNNPVGGGANPFDLDRIRWLKQHQRNRNPTLRWILVDPASTTESYSCPSGIVVGDALPRGRFVVVKMFLEKHHPDSLIERLFRLIKEEDAHGVLIEAEGAHCFAEAWLRKKCLQEGVSCQVYGEPTKRGQARETRPTTILQPLIHNHDLVFLENFAGCGQFLDEITKYPKAPHNDLLMAMCLLDSKYMSFPANVRKTVEKVIPPENWGMHRMVKEIEMRDVASRRGFRRGPRIPVAVTRRSNPWR